MTRGALRYTPVKTSVRCFKCWRRKTLPMHLDDYIRKPKCTFCSISGVKGNKKRGIKAVKAQPVYLKYDKWMNSVVRPVCSDDCYPFPHRKGSKFCRFRKNGKRRQPGDADYSDPQMDRDQQEFYQGD